MPHRIDNAFGYVRVMKIRALLFALPFVLALTGCDEDPPHSHGDACQAIIDACHDVDTGTGQINECHDIGHEYDDDACEPIEAECVALCAAAAEAGGDHDPQDGGTHGDHDDESHDHGDH